MIGERIMPRWRRFYALGRSDRMLVLEAVLLIGLVQAGLRALPFGVLRRMLAAAKRLPSRSPYDAQRIAWAVNACACELPGRTCLVEALAADVMLCRRRHQSILRLGVKKRRGRDVPLEAHAWVESGGAIVAGRLESLDEYQLFPDRSQ